LFLNGTTRESILPTLCLKLYRTGVSGPLFDWLRTLYYARMTYAVRHGGKYSAAFKSAIGVLTGDSASPGLWNIFFADLFFPSDPDDVVLDGIPVSHACRTSRQCCPLLNLRGRCPTSCGCLLRVVPHQFHGLSVLKTQWMLFGPLPNIVPRIYVACPHRFRTRVQVRWGVVCLHHAPEFLPCSCIKSARRLGVS
jgi:hypothetical protein